VRLVVVKKPLELIARRVFSHLVQFQNRYMAVSPYLGESVLDIGCGYGDLIPFLEEAASYIGIDVRCDRITHCKSQYPDYTFYCLNFEKDPLPGPVTSTHFSSIVLLSVIEHLRNHDFVLKQCRNLMNSTTNLIIITPTVIGDFVARAFEKMWFNPSDPYPHLQKYTKDTLDSICEAHGLTARHYKRIGWHRQIHLAIYTLAKV